MTPTEVLSEIRKLPLAAQQQVLTELTEELKQAEQLNVDAQEAEFVQRLLHKGIISEIPQWLPDDELRRNFRPIVIKGEPLGSDRVTRLRNNSTLELLLTGTDIAAAGTAAVTVANPAPGGVYQIARASLSVEHCPGGYQSIEGHN